MSRVIVGMSGGVDSSVAAYLLKEAGHEVIGVTMQTWEEGFENGKAIINDAKQICEKLLIPHHMIDFHHEFKHHVIEYFVDSYIQGRTPNPCVICNRHVKWEALLKACDLYDAEYVATGHYASVVKRSSGRYALKHARTDKKDQTYALYNLSQEQLSKTMMPVGQYEKDEIRKIAAEIGLFVADKPDSQENCFIPDGEYADYICKYRGMQSKAGNFVNSKGDLLGRHKGIIHYTIGQRKGLGIAFGFPAFVTEIRPETNEVVIGTNEEVFSDVLHANCVNYMSVSEFQDGMELIAKIRYNHSGDLCKVYQEDDQTIRCEFNHPVRAITPGQSVVLYDGEYIAGGGIIQS